MSEVQAARQCAGPEAGRVTRRWVVGGAALAAPALLAVACGPTAAGTGGAGQPTGARIGGTVAYMDWRLGGSPLDQQFYNTVRDGFLAKYPDVKWEQIQAEWGKVYLEKIVAMSAGGTPPDVIFSSIIWGRDWWADGLLED